MLGFGQKVSTDKVRVSRLLSRGVEEIFVKESLEKKLLSGKQLRVKLGFDPTGSKIHIGRAIVLRKLREFQDLGHKIVFIVGDFTAKIGDPSDKLEKRPSLTDKQIANNLKDYKFQVGKIIDLGKAEFHFNSKWLSKLNFGEVAELAESFSIQQMSGRRNFKERFDRGEEVSLREFLYPLMQGYDSVAVKADVEIGGFDQLFNLKAGRTIQKHYGQVEQDILTTSMLEGTDGRKMSTSWGNVINVTDSPKEMFGKIMSLKDELITKYLLLCTDTEEAEIKRIGAEMETGNMNPKNAKIILAKKIVSVYYTNKDAERAADDFDSTFKEGSFPSDAPEFVSPKGGLLSEALLSSGLVSSKTEFRRLIDEKAISAFGGEVITDPFFKIEKEVSLKIGKKRFIKIEVQS